jgi:hypothetical protein
MTQELQDLLDAIGIIHKLRAEFAGDNCDFIWGKLYRAGHHLENHLEAYFAEVTS